MTSDSSDGLTIMLTKSLTCGSEEGALTVPSDKKVVLDLNGFTLDRNNGSGSYTDETVYSGEGGCVIVNNGELTIKDTSEEQTGKITGGNGHWYYGGIGGIFNRGTLYFAGGTITGNRGRVGGILQ